MLSHSAVESRLTSFMKEHNWKRVKNGRFKFSNLHPDRVFQRDGEVIVAEVKPSNVTGREVSTGIGQSACYLSYDVRPYLVIPLDWFEDMKDVFHKLPWLGVIAYGIDASLFPLRSHNLRTVSLDAAVKMYVAQTCMVEEYLHALPKENIQLV